MARTPEQKAKHAAYKRKYRARSRDERDAALYQLGRSASELMQHHGYTVGQLVDLIVRQKGES